MSLTRAVARQSLQSDPVAASPASAPGRIPCLSPPQDAAFSCSGLCVISLTHIIP
jgi:hypothetical protein